MWKYFIGPDYEKSFDQNVVLGKAKLRCGAWDTKVNNVASDKTWGKNLISCLAVVLDRAG